MEIIMSTGVVSFLIILSFMFLFNKILNSKVKKSSIPTNWPIIGMMPALLLNFRQIHDYMTTVLQEVGGTFLFKGPWFTNMEILLTSDPANVHYILSKNFHKFSKGSDFKKIFDILGEGLINAESESWESQRKTAMALFRGASFEKSVAKTSWNKVEECLIPILDLVSETGAEIDMQEVIHHFFFQCTSILVLGHDPTSKGDDLPRLPDEKVFADIEEAAMQRHMLPETFWKIQQWLKVGKEKRLSKGRESLDHFISDCIELKQRNWKELDGKEDSDLLTSYMRKIIIEEGTADVTNNKLLKDNMLSFMFAGKDTISATLTWFFYLLATNPEEQKKIRQETLKNSPAGKWKFSNMGEIKKLLYLHGALCETIRLFPAVALNHKAPLKADRLPSGHQIKPNTMTVLSIYSMGRMESIWGKDCLEFKPGRWISETGGVQTEPSYKFTSFGAGPRTCLGKDMSFTQLKIVAAAIVNSFHIQLAESHITAPRNSVVLHMKHGLKLKVSKYV